MSLPTSFIDYSHLLNPVLHYPNWSIKDCACAYYEEKQTFYLFFSAFYEDKGMIRSHVVGVATKDFEEFSEPILHIDGMEEGWIGLCSPDLLKVDDTYYLTFNSWGDLPGRSNQLFYKTTKDFVEWSEGYSPLAANLTEGKRAIDAALIFEAGTYYLFWKERVGEDSTRLAKASSMSEDFQYVGDGYPTLVMKDGNDNDLIHENFCFFKVDGKWRMITTDYMKNSFDLHNSYIYTMIEDGSKDTDFLSWGEGYRLEIVKQSFNCDHRANAAALYDWRNYDGYFYLIYAGNQENETFATRGHNRLGISRSRDLIHWIPLQEK